MKSTKIAGILRGVLTLIVLCAFAKADSAGGASRFTAHALCNVGESEGTVGTHFEANARSRRVVHNDGLIAQIEAYTSLVGKGIAGTQSSSGTADALRHALSETGQALHSPLVSPKNSGSAPSSKGTKVVEVPRSRTALAPKPSPKTVFVFANGERLEIYHYTIDAGFLHLADGGQQRTIGLGALDLKTTLAVNRERGIELKIPQSRSELTIAF